MPECLHPTGLVALDSAMANRGDTRPVLRKVARKTAQMQQSPAGFVGIEVACLTVHESRRWQPTTETAEQ